MLKEIAEQIASKKYYHCNKKVKEKGVMSRGTTGRWG